MTYEWEMRKWAESIDFKTGVLVWSPWITPAPQEMQGIQGIHELGMEQNCIWLFTHLSLKLSLSFNCDCRCHTPIVALPVALSPGEITAILLPHYS